MRRQTPLLVASVLVVLAASGADWSRVATERGDALIAEYFQRETNQIADTTFADIHTLADWQARKEVYRRQLFEMLGLEPLPEKTPLNPVVTGQIEHDDFTIEKLHFQSRPGLYVTGNLYLPKQRTGPAPAVLYVCGHAGAKKDGVSFGNKTSYHHHGVWFARHGYVCLTIDTLQLGEIEGLHHGTYRERMFWWISRGYTPAGVEAWNCIRSLDFLQTRSEVDPERIGVTGRSGGGAYSWWIAALDERIKVAVPVAGITSLKNHVVDGCVAGHCDCMYMNNTYRWDFPLVAALVAPRPLLISNTDKDSIFPLDGVYDTYLQTQKIYDLYEASDKLGLHICEGGHKDTQQLRVHAFQWMNRWLMDEQPLITIPAEKLFQPEQLRVFEDLPADEINTQVHETFVAPSADPPIPETKAQWAEMRDGWMASLREKVFRGWPQEEHTRPLDIVELDSMEQGDFRLQVFEIASQRPYRLPLYVVTLRNESAGGPCMLECLDQQLWEETMLGLKIGFPDLDISPELGGPLPQHWTRIADKLSDSSDGERFSAWVGFAPRGIGPTEWSKDKEDRTHIARRFVLLGQTRAGMRVWDVRRALQATRQLPALSGHELWLQASRHAAVWSLYASLFEKVEHLALDQPPTCHRNGPSLLNVSRFLDLPQTVTMAAERAPVRVEFQGDTAPWGFATSTIARWNHQEGSEQRLKMQQVEE